MAGMYVLCTVVSAHRIATNLEVPPLFLAHTHGYGGLSFGGIMVCVVDKLLPFDACLAQGRWGGGELIFCLP